MDAETENKRHKLEEGLREGRERMTEGLREGRERVAESLREARERVAQDAGVSLRGRTAREIVKVANHLPVLGDMRRNGELQNIISGHEREWKCPERLVRTQVLLESAWLEGISQANADPDGADAPDEVKEPDGADAPDEVTERTFPAELLTDASQSASAWSRHVILQLHGGGYYGRLHNTYRDAAAMYIDVSGGYDVFSIDYRTAPERPYPAALEDAVAAYKWLLESDYRPERIIVAGDSAGGGLSLALCLYLRDHGIPLPSGIITMSAWTDLTKSGDSYQENYDRDPIFGGSRHTLVYKEGYYGAHDPMDPYISPVNGDYRSFPPMLMQVGDMEMLLDDTLSVAERARYAGARVKVHIYKGMFHIFQMGFTLYPEAREAWHEIGQFLRIIDSMEH